MAQLKEIRARYADPRHNFICHINDEMQHCSVCVLTKQISDDLKIKKSHYWFSIFYMLRQFINHFNDFLEFRIIQILMNERSSSL